MPNQRVLEDVRAIIRKLEPAMKRDELREDASLSGEIGFDSIQLEELITHIKLQIADIDFTPWYVQVTRNGNDTIGSLVEYVERHPEKIRIGA